MSAADDLKQKYRLPVAVENADGDLDDLDRRPAEYVAFRIDRQARPANALLDFWFADGRRRAIAYAHLYEVDFDPSEGMVLAFSEHLVTLRGRRLQELYRGLKRHRVVFVWEADRQASRLAADSASVVTEIRVAPRLPQTVPFSA